MNIKSLSIFNVEAFLLGHGRVMFLRKNTVPTRNNHH